MTSTCLLVLLLTSIVASERVNDFAEGDGTKSRPSPPSTPGTVKRDLYYGLTCHPPFSNRWDCDDVTYNVICTKKDANGNPTHEPTGETEEGKCGCHDKDGQSYTHYDNFLSFMCLPDDRGLSDPDTRKELSTQTFHETCGLSTSSILGCREGLYCNPDSGKICTCPPNKPIRDGDKQDCDKLSPDDVNEACVEVNDDCIEHTKCVSSKCKCVEGRGKWLTTPGRCRGVTVKGECGNKDDCEHESKMVCTNNQCECPTNMHIYNPDLFLCQGFVGVKCEKHEDCAQPVQGSECLGDKKCGCAGEMVYDAEEGTAGKCVNLPKFKEPCKEKLGCAPLSVKCMITDAVAKTGECGCKEANQEYVNGVCRIKPQVTHDQKCTNTGDCVTAHGLECIEGKCKCPKGKLWSQHLCRDTSEVKSCTDETIATTCHTARPRNMVCDDADGDGEGKCVCPPGMDYSLPGQGCKLIEGQTCVKEGATEPGDIVCLSDKCDKDGKCDCPPLDGVKQTYSSEAKKCVTDFYHLPCNPEAGPEGCRPADYVAPPTPAVKSNEMKKDGLQCKTKKEGTGSQCECHEDMAYFQGYCIRTTKPHGEDCDPTGNAPTCDFKTPFFQVCKEEPVGVHKCACTHKAVIKDDKPHFIERVWDEATKTCMLKPGGAACEMHDECQSDKCKDKVCAGHVPDGGPCEANPVCVSNNCQAKKCSKRGAGTTIAATLFLVIAALIVTLLH